MTRRLVFLALAVSVLQVVACLADSPGVVVGTTWQPTQSLGSVGKTIAACSDGSKYFVWSNAVDYPAPRLIYFNYVDASGNWYLEGIGGRVNTSIDAVYTQADIIYGNRLAVAYHSMQGTRPTYTTLAIDAELRGMGLFDYYNPPDSVSGNRRTVWPYITVDRQDNIHILMTENTDSPLMKRMCYTRSNNGGATWVNPVQLVDSVMVVSGIIKASHVSDNVVIAYSKPANTGSQINSDIAYILSNDGLTWDFQNRVNVTNYGSDDDSLWAYTDLDVIFDYNDNIHIIWNALSTETNDYFSKAHLFHFTNRTNEIDQVRPPWPDYNWPDSSCDLPYFFSLPLSKMNLGVCHGGMYNYIYAIWTQFDTSDCSAGGHANGDIYMSFSSETMEWQPPVNLTNSRTPGCACGECDNDNYASLDDEIRDSLNIFYSDDKNNGCPFDSNHVATESNMLYLAVPNPFPAIGIDEQSAKPSNFQLAQNYPNPFNSKTVISFELKESAKVKLEIFDITGARIASLANKEMAAGHHQVNWDAEKYASGTYFYKLNAGERAVTKQMVLVK
jgi:hypothetical protein